MAGADGRRFESWLTTDELRGHLGWTHSRIVYYVRVLRPFLDSRAMVYRKTCGARGHLIFHPLVPRVFDHANHHCEKMGFSLPMVLIQMYGGLANDFIAEDLANLEAERRRLADQVAYMTAEPRDQDLNESPTSVRSGGFLRKLMGASRAHD